MIPAPAPPMSSGACFLCGPQVQRCPVPQRKKKKITTGVQNYGPDRDSGLTGPAMFFLMGHEN